MSLLGFLSTLIFINIYSFLAINNFIPSIIRYFIEFFLTIYTTITDKTLEKYTIFKFLLVAIGNAFLIPHKINKKITYWLFFINILAVGIFDIFNKDLGNALTAFYLLYKLPSVIVSISKKDNLSTKFIIAYTLWNLQFISNTYNYGSEFLISTLLIPLISICNKKWLIHRAVSLNLIFGFDRFISDEKYNFLPILNWNTRGRINGFIVLGISYLILNL